MFIFFCAFNLLYLIFHYLVHSFYNNLLLWVSGRRSNKFNYLYYLGRIIIGFLCLQQIHYHISSSTGSVKNKEAYYRAYRRIHPGYCNASNCHIDRELSSLKNPFLSDSGINMRLKMANCPMYGEDVQLNWLLENLRNENKTLKFNLCAQIITYSGIPMDQFWKDCVNVTLGPREGKRVKLSNTLLFFRASWFLGSEETS